MSQQLVTIDVATLKALIAEAVAEAVAPLRAQISRLEALSSGNHHHPAAPAHPPVPSPGTFMTPVAPPAYQSVFPAPVPVPAPAPVPVPAPAPVPVVVPVATRVGEQKVAFDERLIADAVSLGFSDHKVRATLTRLYSQGLPCNDMNVLLDALSRE
jgi:hypothetical protein